MVSFHTLTDGMRLMLEHLAKAEFEDIPQATLDRASLAIADTFGCILAGNKDEAALAAHGQARDWGGKEEATMWGYADKAPVHQAAMVNALCARANDHGPVETNAGGRFKPMHICETMAPVSLAMAEKLNASGRELLLAHICAEDFVGRLSGSMELPLPLDCRGTLNAMGAAVIYGKMHKFSPDKFADALWLALHQLNGIRQGVHFQLSQGLSAMHGIIAADLANRGLKGVDDPETEIKRLAEIFVRDFSSEDLLENLGKIFYTTTTFKQWPACRATHAGIECAMEIRRQIEIRPENVKEIILTISPWAMKHPVARPFQKRGYSHGDAIYSIQYMVATALLHGEINLNQLLEPAVSDERVQALISKIRLSTDGWPINKDDTFLATALAVKDASGEYKAYVSLPKGNAAFGNGLSRDELQKKFMANAAFSGILPESGAEAAWAFFNNLQERPNLKSLSELV